MSKRSKAAPTRAVMSKSHLFLVSKFKDSSTGFGIAFVDRAIVQSCVDPNEIERPYVAGTRYVAFVDPSGGSSDNMTLAIGHADKDRTVVDVLREIVAPFDPESAAEEFAKVLKSYGLSNGR
jgi:hypothetical protein